MVPDEENFQEEESDLICPACGMRYSAFRRTGLLGCETCYSVFIARLLPVIRACQGCDRHVVLLNEKNEDEITESFRLARTLETLKARLENYMREGNFDDAAEVNKKIKEITKILYRGEET